MSIILPSTVKEPRPSAAAFSSASISSAGVRDLVGRRREGLVQRLHQAGMHAGAAREAEAPRPFGALAVGRRIAVVGDGAQDADHRHAVRLGGEGDQPLGQFERFVARHRSRLEREVLAAQHHGDDARAALGDVVRSRPARADARSWRRSRRRPTGMPRSRSSSLTASSSRRRCCTPSVLVTNSADRPGRTAASMSGDGQPQRPVDAHGDVGAAAHHLRHRLGQHGARRRLLRPPVTLSSRSTRTQSAPRSCALSMNFGTLPGT